MGFDDIQIGQQSIDEDAQIGHQPVEDRRAIGKKLGQTHCTNKDSRYVS